MANILVVDDELGIRDLLSEILNDEGHSVDLAENATQARAARAGSNYDLVLLDIWMPDTDGVSLLKEWATGGVLTMVLTLGEDLEPKCDRLAVLLVVGCGAHWIYADCMTKDAAFTPPGPRSAAPLPQARLRILRRPDRNLRDLRQ